MVHLKLVVPLVCGLALCAAGCAPLRNHAAVRVRLHSAHTAVQDTYTTDNLIVTSVDRLAAGYQRLGQGSPAGVREAFGAQIPLGRLLKAARAFELSGHFYKAARVEEREAALAFRPTGRIELGGRWFDLARGEGAAFTSNFRQHASLDSPANIGVGGFVASGLNRSFGAYGWARIKHLDGLFVGAGRHPNDWRYVVGWPGAGGRAVRYFGLRASSGFSSDEVVFASSATNMKPIDFYSALVPIKGGDAMIATSGVFAYQVPPVSTRGSGFNAGVAHRRIPLVGDFLEAEGVAYAGRFFVGIRYASRSTQGTRAVIGVPIGYQFSGGDGLTRNFLRVVPSYDRSRSAAALAVLFEWTR